MQWQRSSKTGKRGKRPTAPAPAPEVKRGPGRPRKHPAPVAGPAASSGVAGVRIPLSAVSTPTPGDRPAKPGRPAPSPAIAPAAAAVVPQLQIFLTAEGLSLVFKMIGDAAAELRGEHWKFSPAECENLGGSWKQALDVLLPDLGASKWTVLGLALVNTAIVLYPRMLEDAERAKQRSSANGRGGPARAPSDSGPGGDRQEHSTA